LEYRRVVVYVGRSVKPLARLVAHINAYNRRKLGQATPRVKGILFDRIWFKPCEHGELAVVEQELITRFRPRYNDIGWKAERRELKIVVRGKAYVLNPGCPPATPRTQVELRRL